MRSLPKVIKPGRLVPSDEVYRIPDDTPRPLPPDEEPAEGEEDTAPVSDAVAPEEESEEERERRQAEKLRQREEFLENQARAKAEEISQRILQSAKTEREKLLEQAQAEAGRIREEARREAYEAVYQEKRQTIEGRLAELDRLMDQLQRDQADFLAQYEEGLSGLALEIAQKLLDESILKHQELMKPLVNKAVSTVKNSEWISVQVSDRLPGLAEELKQELNGRPGLPPVEVTAGEMAPGGCMVHTPEGIVDASVETQLGNLRGIFEGK